jgi:enoyl-CoA hydratase/carnithine racemase
MPTEDISLERDGERVTVVLDRPAKSNALTGDMFAGLRDVFTTLADETVSVATVRGRGGNFSAGVDMSGVPDWAEMPPLEVREILEDVHEALRAIEALDAPVVAALEGHVLGGGLELALACDIRIAHDDAVFGLPESEMGLAMDLGGAQKLPGMIGEGMTKYLVMTGGSIDAERAYDVGLVEECHSDSAFDDAIAAMEESLASKPTYVHDIAKRQVHSARPLNLDEAMQQAIHHAISAYHEEETQRRVAEFFEN